MILTNGKIIVDANKDIAYLTEVMDIMKERATDKLTIELDVELIEEDEERKYPYIKLNSVIEFHNLQKICEPDIEIQYRAMGNETIQMPEDYVKDFDYHFTPEEMAGIASKMAENISEKEMLEEEKKASAKAYATKIDGVEKIIKNNGRLYREGYQVNTYNCSLHLDFEEKKRIWTDKETGTIIHTEELKPEDYSKMVFGEVFDAKNEEVKEEPKDTSDPFEGTDVENVEEVAPGAVLDAEDVDFEETES